MTAERTQPSPASSAQLEAAKDVIAFVGPGLLVLRNMLHVAKLPLGEEKAKEMIKAVQDFLAADFPTPAPPSAADGEYDYELALMLWPFVNAKELSEDKFAKVARKSFAAFTRDHHRSCMAAWKVYCENRRNTARPATPRLRRASE